MKLIPLSRGKYAKVDDEDFERVNQFKWSYCPNRTGYAIRQIGTNRKSRHQSMARFIMDAQEGLFVDHLNGDTLDNQRANLRLATHGENQMNRRMPKTNTSGYKGVQWSKQKGSWIAVASLRGRLYWGGSFRKKVDAARAYDRLALKLFGEFARLNFPEKTAQDLRSLDITESDQAA